MTGTTARVTGATSLSAVFCAIGGMVTGIAGVAAMGSLFFDWTTVGFSTDSLTAAGAGVGGGSGGEINESAMTAIRPKRHAQKRIRTKYFM